MTTTAGVATVRKMTKRSLPLTSSSLCRPMAVADSRAGPHLGRVGIAPVGRAAAGAQPVVRALVGERFFAFQAGTAGRLQHGTSLEKWGPTRRW